MECFYTDLKEFQEFRTSNNLCVSLKFLGEIYIENCLGNINNYRLIIVRILR